LSLVGVLVVRVGHQVEVLAEVTKQILAVRCWRCRRVRIRLLSVLAGLLLQAMLVAVVAHHLLVRL